MLHSLYDIMTDAKGGASLSGNNVDVPPALIHAHLSSMFSAVKAVVYILSDEERHGRRTGIMCAASTLDATSIFLILILY
jgi:hypothetical protein